MGDSVLSKTELYINGHPLLLLNDFKWNTTPGPVNEEIVDMADNQTKCIPVSEYAEGLATCVAGVNPNSNTPLDIMDTLGFKLTNSYYDTATGVVVHGTTYYDISEFASGNLMMGPIPIETRQVEATTDLALDMNGTYRKFAFKFIAPAEKIDTIKLKLREAVNGDVTGWKMEIWSDSAGPNAIVTNTVTATVTGKDPADGATFASATWLSIDVSSAGFDIMGTGSLVPGTDYWLVLEATDNDALYVCVTTNERYTEGDVYHYNGAVWAHLADATAKNGTFIIQGTNTKGGNTVDVYQYNSGKTKYLKTHLEGCVVTIDSLDIGAQKAQKHIIKFKSQDITKTRVV